MGIEPTSLAWEAGILPMNYARTSLTHIFYHYSVKIARRRGRNIRVNGMIFLVWADRFGYNEGEKIDVIL